MSVLEWNSKDCLITFGEVLVTGLGDDVFCRITPDEDDFDLFMGADGQGTRSRNNNNAATIELTLAYGSPTNALLSALSKVDRATGQGVRPFFLKDNNGSESHLAPTAWIQKRPDREYSKKVGTKTWVLRTDELIDSDGASNPPPSP